MLLLNDLAAPLHLLIIDSHVLQVHALDDDLVLLAEHLQNLPLLLLILPFVFPAAFGNKFNQVESDIVAFGNTNNMMFI